jgi:hypothetical protein
VLWFNLPPQNSAGKAHGWIKILKISIDLASWHPFFEGEFKGEGQIIIVQIREPKGISEISEEKLKELTDILVNRYV